MAHAGSVFGRGSEKGRAAWPPWSCIRPRYCRRKRKEKPLPRFRQPAARTLRETKQEVLYALSSNIHDIMAFALAGAIVLHVAAALLHEIRGDAMLGRMLGRRGPDGMTEER
ncbi:cytochrome b/b6 domain-containing protein [Methylobacterium haplocladii]|uniref:cytochrome b/b6 domain-containing protein n=1 Tax=Methylobacterium haplocladii TaxID=1176176 RepID=UPI0011BF194C|nr:cytochrome b/b6 domain-containing protein [Methylobacterium haplocladii]